ncbi:MAG: efflux RND transporter periplasmic adaptor subunit [Elusimicrobia bacterium]|nr:efflux RND transporter periplasmic adaptor subunit [Elusimicrobiota bacterium]MBU2615205.1 efflux RND transporter periplasmic adaptor subunit [Elusimicrobiota bacterium]
MNKKMMVLRIVIAVIVVLGLVFYFVSKNFKGNKNSQAASGVIECTQIEITSKISGRIQKLYAKEGDTVTQGKLLVELAHDEISAQFDQVDANYKNAQANLARYKELYGAGSISKQQLDNAQTQVEVLSANMRNAKAQLDNASLKAPISGIVLSKNAEEGEIAFPGMSILTVTNPGDTWIKIYVPETMLGRVKLGQDVKVKTDSYPNKIYSGKVSNIASEAEFTPKNIQIKDERVKLVFAVKVRIENPNQELKQGMPADAEIALEGK